MDEKISGVGEFFGMPIPMADAIVRQGGGVDEVIAALVLRRGAGSHPSTAWTENSIIRNVGMRSGAAKNAFQWLVEHNFIERINTDAECGDNLAHPDDPDNNYVNKEKETSRKKKNRRTRMVFMCDEVITYLPNSLVDRADKECGPIGKLYKNFRINPRCGISPAKAKLDLIMLLLHLYGVQDIGMHGGVSPHALHCKWVPVSDGMGAATSNAINFVEGSDAAIYEIERGESYSSNDFVAATLFYITDKSERLERFQFALKVLKGLDFYYEVLNIWAGDPLETIDAEMAYPLYIFERRAREKNEPYLAKDINAFALTVYSYNEEDTMFDRNGELEGFSPGKFRFIGFGRDTYVPMSVIRMRYRPHCRDNGIDLAMQATAVSNWALVIQELREAFTETTRRLLVSDA